MGGLKFKQNCIPSSIEISPCLFVYLFIVFNRAWLHERSVDSLFFYSISSSLALVCNKTGCDFRSPFPLFLSLSLFSFNVCSFRIGKYSNYCGDWAELLMLSGRNPPVSLVLLGFFSPPWTWEEILLSDYIACELTFLEHRALLSIYLYDVLEREETFPQCIDMSVSLAGFSQVLPKPSLLCSSVFLEGGWQSKETFSCKAEPLHTLPQTTRHRSSRTFSHWLRLGACVSEGLSSASLFPWTHVFRFPVLQELFCSISLGWMK